VNFLFTAGGDKAPDKVVSRPWLHGKSNHTTSVASTIGVTVSTAAPRHYARTGLRTRAGRSLHNKGIPLRVVAEMAGVSIVAVHNVLCGRSRSKNIEATVVKVLGLRSGVGLFVTSSQS
jgi:hypothetical protein